VNRRASALVLSGLLLFAVVLAATASASNGRIRITEASAKFPNRSFVLELPSDRQLRAGQVKVSENGDPVSGVSVVPAVSGSRQQFGVVLVIDASESMRGAPIEGAFAAARAFATHLNGRQQLAVVTFNSTSHLTLGFTSDRFAIQKALSVRPSLAYGTHIYDAVATAAGLLQSAKISAGSIVVLSDGADVGSRLTRAAAIQIAQRARVRVFTVGLRSRFFRAAPLQGIAGGTGGAYGEASSPAQLTAIYNQLGSRLAREYLVNYQSLAGPAQEVSVSITVAGVGRRVESAYVTPRLGLPKAAVPYHESFLRKLWASPVMMILIALIAAALAASAVLAVAGGPRKASLRERVGEFVSVPSLDGDERASALLTEKVLEGTDQLLGQTKWWLRFKSQLDIAMIKMPAEQIAVLTAIATLFLVWLLTAISGSLLVGLIALPCVPLGVRALIKRLLDRQRRMFADQLPDNLQVLASALRAGHSFVGALSVVVADAPEPSRREFRRVVADEQLGVPLEEALEVVVQRMDNVELEQVALVAALQRHTGGNTAEVLDRVTETIRERMEVRRRVQTLTAQGRMSRWVVSFLPVALLGAISLLNPHYISALFDRAAGRVLLVIAGLMVISGSYVIKRIVNIKV
jgi:tight adherence protein B